MPDTFLFDSWEKLLTVFLLCLKAYPLLILILRLFGKRSLTQINLFDFIITLTYGAGLSRVITAHDLPLAEGAVVLFMLTLLQFIISKLTTRSKTFARFIKAPPTLLYSEGKFYPKAMERERIRMEDLRAKARKKGLSSFEKVEAIVLEGDGSISIIKKEENSSKETLKGIRKVE